MSDTSSKTGQAEHKHKKNSQRADRPAGDRSLEADLKKRSPSLLVERELFKAVVDSSAHGILVLDKDGRVIYCNEKFGELWNVPIETLRQAIGREILAYLENQLQTPKTLLDKFKKLSTIQEDFHDTLRLKDDRIFQCRCSTLKEGDIVLGRVAVFRNITEQIRLEDALRESEEKYRTFVKDFKGIAYKARLETWTPLFFHGSVREITGYEADDFVDGNPRWDQIIHPDDLSGKIVESVKKLRDVPNYATEREYRILCRNGQVKWVHELTQNICDESGTPVYCQGVIYDITDKWKMEQEIHRTSKLESVGLLAGGIAHDFNNLLTAIIGNISLAKDKIHPDDDAVDNLGRAQKACSLAKELTQQLLTFSKGGAPVKKPIRIATLIRDSAVMAVRGSSVRCKFGISNDLWPVEVDDGQMKQAINNLVLNARQAMRGGGTIEVLAENVFLQNQDVFNMEQGKYVRISVVDHGVGIPAKNLHKIFDPYFTTKQNGTGLGLATTHSIVQQHGGRVAVESELGVGSSFHIMLPAVEEEVPEEIPQQEPVRKRKVLVLDDEEMIRQVIGEMLLVAGYEPEFAGDGETAIDLYQRAFRSKHPFDAVIVDLTIPGGIGGGEVLPELLKVNPRVKAIVSSGYSNDPIMANYKQHGFAGCVAKPYEFEELRNTLDSIMND